jgi:uncharacterized repeat protein (TIGR03847 family)
MPRIVYRHELVQRFIVSAIGEPGQREFFIQIKSESGINTVAVEKEQVRVLALQFDELIKELRRNGSLNKPESSVMAKIDNEPLEIPIESDFQVGVINLSWSEKRIQITLQAISSDDELLLDDLDSGPDLIFANIPIDIVKGFCLRAKNLMEAGRSACPFCALPVNPNGHLCPRANGYRR